MKTFIKFLGFLSLFFFGKSLLAAPHFKLKPNCPAEIFSTWTEAQKRRVVDCGEVDNHSGKRAFFVVQENEKYNYEIELAYYVATSSGKLPTKAIQIKKSIGEINTKTKELLRFQVNGKVHSSYVADINLDGSKDYIVRVVNTAGGALFAVSYDQDSKQIKYVQFQRPEPGASNKFISDDYLNHIEIGIVQIALGKDGKNNKIMVPKRSNVRLVSRIFELDPKTHAFIQK